MVHLCVVQLEALLRVEARPADVARARTLPRLRDVEVEGPVRHARVLRVPVDPEVVDGLRRVVAQVTPHLVLGRVGPLVGHEPLPPLLLLPPAVRVPLRPVRCHDARGSEGLVAEGALERFFTSVPYAAVVRQALLVRQPRGTQLTLDSDLFLLVNFHYVLLQSVSASEHLSTLITVVG